MSAVTPGNTPAALTIASFAWAPRWVAWQVEDRGPQGKSTKVPYAPDGRKARADKPATWGTRKEAKARSAKLPKPHGVGGIGLELGVLDDTSILAGIDLDTCRDTNGQIAPWAMQVIERFATYSEVSPSGTGAKLFFVVAADPMPSIAPMLAKGGGRAFKQPGTDHPPGIELYTGGRYFAVTDERLDGAPAELATIPAETLLWLLEEAGPALAGTLRDKTVDGTHSVSKARPGRDQSRSAAALRVGAQLRRDGATFNDMVQAMLLDPEVAAWTAQKGQADNARELRRIWDKADLLARPVPRSNTPHTTMRPIRDVDAVVPGPAPVAAPADPALPVITVTAGELHIQATAAESAIIASELPIFQRGSDLVRPATRELPAAHGRVTLSAGLAPVTMPGLLDAFSEVARWEKYDGRTGGMVRTNPPKLVPDVLLSRAGRWRFPVVAGVITTPTMRPDGSILSAPGFDPVTRLYHAADPAITLSPRLANPTRKDASAALALLNGLIAEFPFTTPAARAVALAALLTPVVRGAMSVVPLIAVRAHTAGTGKSYLLDTAAAIATGRSCPVISVAPGDDAETEKRLAGLLLSGAPLLSLDNVNGELGGDLLCQAVERPFVRLRPLGSSAITEIESRATITATGNNLRVRGDLVRRTILCDLDAGVERPELRRFTADPVRTVLADRGRFVSACLAIVRAYFLAGRPNPPQPLASFEKWSGTVRGALVWLGCADPVASMETARDDDPELAALAEVAAVWSAAFGPVPTICRDVIEAAGNVMANPGLHDALARIAPGRFGIDPARLGRWMLGREGRIVGGRRFKRDGATRGAARWALEVVSR